MNGRKLANKTADVCPQLLYFPTFSPSSFSSSYFYIFLIFIFIYLAAPGLCCSMQDLVS